MTVTVEHILSATWKKTDLRDTKTLGFVLESYNGIFLITDASDSTASYSKSTLYLLLHIFIIENNCSSSTIYFNKRMPPILPSLETECIGFGRL